MKYLLTCAPGLESILADEAAVKCAWRSVRVSRGQALMEAPTHNWPILRCADNVYQWLGQGTAGRHKAHLPELAKWAADMIASADLACAEPVLRVTASRRGKHSYSRFDAAAAVEEAVAAAMGWRRGDEQNHTVALRLDIDEDSAELSLKLTDAAFRFRGNRDFVSGALRPTVAHALVWLSQPRENDVFVDPFCGSGGIALERAAYPAKQILGFDIDSKRLETARVNDITKQVHWQVGDAMKLPFAAGEVDTIVCNPPWGGQVTADENLVRFLENVRPIMKENGQVILLQPTIPSASGWQVVKQHTVSLHGTLAGIYQCFLTKD